MIFLTGGARSGKSAIALKILERHRPVTYIATGAPSDHEMEERIARHRDERPDHWTLVEEPLGVAGAIEAVDSEHGLVLDCLTLWVANLLEHHSDFEILERSDAAIAIAADRDSPTVVVTNEVGAGIVPMDAVGRRFRDLQGRVNRAWSEEASLAFLVVAGRMLELRAFDEHTV